MSIRTENPEDPSIDHTYYKYHYWDGSKSLTENIIDLIISLSDSDLAELPPLYDSVDMESVKGVLLETNGTPKENVRICFEYGSYRITIHSLGVIVAEEKNHFKGD